MSDKPTVFVVDDDSAMRDSLRQLIASTGFEVQCFGSAKDFLRQADRSGPACLVLDLRMPGMSGMDLHEKLVQHEIKIPVIFVTGHGDVSTGVRAMKSGAVDFLEKPYDPEQLIEAIRQGIGQDAQRQRAQRVQASANALLAQLTNAESEIMAGIVDGKTNKQIAEELDLSLRTVQYRRAGIMKKMKVNSKPELITLIKTTKEEAVATAG